MKRVLAIFLALALLTTVVAAGCSSAPPPSTSDKGKAAETPPTPLAQGVTKDSIKLGIVSDLTAGGSAPGAAATGAYQAYVKWLNDRGGINGRKIELIIEDGKRDLAREVSLYKKLRTQDKVFTVVNTWTTGAQNALKEDYTKDENVVFPASRALFLFDPKTYPYVFITSPTYTAGYYAMIDYVVEKKPNAKVGLIYPDDTFGQDALKWIKLRAEAKGVKLFPEVFNWTEIDATSQISNLKKADVDYVFIALGFPAAGVIFKTADKLGFDKTIMTNFTTTDAAAFKHVKDSKSFRNSIGVGFYAAAGEDVPGNKFFKEIAEKFGIAKEVWQSHWFTLAGVDAMVFFEGLKRAGSNPTPKGVRDAIEALKDFDTKGLSAPITFGPNKHIGSNSVKFVKPDLEKELFVPITSFIEVK